MKPEYKENYVKYKALKKKIKKTREQATTTLKENQELKRKKIEIKRNTNDTNAYDDIMLTPVGEAQSEFLTMLD